MPRFLLLFSLACIFSNHSYAENSSCTDHHCIAVIDAGSSGSRLHIFAYDQDETNTATHIQEIWSKKIKPGYASIDLNQNTVDAYLTILFSGAPVRDTPVYFYATAGMRLLPQEKQKNYYQALKNWFGQHPEWPLVESKTITGNEEALYDWLAVNYHLDKLHTLSQSVGVMDIGGASVQIVFPIQQDADIPGKNVLKLDLYGQPIQLFVYSFLGLGQNEMSHQLLDANACFATNYPLPDGEAGMGNAVSCSEEVTALINGVHKVNHLVQPSLAQSTTNEWYAIGGLANLAESKPFHFGNNQLTNQDLLEQANNEICHQQWEELKSKFPDNEFLDIYCLLPAFYYSLMVDGYGLLPNQPINYVPTEDNLDWTLGVVLHHGTSLKNFRNYSVIEKS